MCAVSFSPIKRFWARNRYLPSLYARRFIAYDRHLPWRFFIVIRIRSSRSWNFISTHTLPSHLSPQNEPLGSRTVVDCGFWFYPDAWLVDCGLLSIKMPKTFIKYMQSEIFLTITDGTYFCLSFIYFFFLICINIRIPTINVDFSEKTTGLRLRRWDKTSNSEVN